ncbi:hypothetical protein U1Q18_038505 [Sarracenia purpurea var. burkii]
MSKAMPQHGGRCGAEKGFCPKRYLNGVETLLAWTLVKNAMRVEPNSASIQAVVLAEEEDRKITAVEKSAQAKPAEESQYSVKIFGFPVKELVSFGFGFSGKRQPEKEELQAR